MATVAATTAVKWSLEAEYLQACNCDYGCPCEFEAPPTRGFCEGVGAWRITNGKHGDVQLDGLCFAFAARWPKAIHQGNGTAQLFFDEKANPRQRDALLQIASGQAGGMPFEIIATTFSNVLEPKFVPFKFNFNGKNSSFTVGNNAIVASMESIKNRVTGQPESVRVEHETGFVFKGADVVSARECRVSAGELNYSHLNKCGFVTRVKYGN
jgi:hypothetical protein